jgi:hypothetical protein
VEDETPVFGRIVSAPMAPGAEAGSGYCSKPGHGNFELSMFCQDCNEKYCLRCTGDHVGHATGDTASGKGLIQRSSSIPSKSESRSEFDDQMARFRRTTSASSLAAAVRFFPPPKQSHPRSTVVVGASMRTPNPKRGFRRCPCNSEGVTPCSDAHRHLRPPH